MKEEIWRARHSLLTGQDSDGVKSVIKLLEQTYDRLQQDKEDEITSLPTNTFEVSSDLVFERTFCQKLRSDLKKKLCLPLSFF